MQFLSGRKQQILSHGKSFLKIGILGFVFVGMLNAAFAMRGKLNIVRAQEANVSSVLEKLEVKHDRLTQDIKNVTEPEAIERYIRENYRVVKEEKDGKKEELILIIPEDK